MILVYCFETSRMLTKDDEGAENLIPLERFYMSYIIVTYSLIQKKMGERRSIKDGGNIGILFVSCWWND